MTQETWNNVFDDAVARLNLSVIDAYMRTSSSWGKQGFKVHSDPRYYGVDDKNNVPGDSDYCARPYPTGYGGGQVYDSIGQPPRSEDRFVSKFDDIRREISGIVGLWRRIPDPDEIGEALAVLDEVCNSFVDGVTRPTCGNGSLAPNITRIWDDLIGQSSDLTGRDDYYKPALSGTAVDAFKQYIGNLSVALGGCQTIAQALHQHVATQQELWAATRANVITVMSSVANECAALAGEPRWPGGAADFALAGAQVGLAGASIALGPVGSAAATGAGVVLTGVDYAMGDPVQQNVKIESYEGAMDVLRKLLNGSFYGVGVNVTVEFAERRTRTGISTIIQEIDSQRDKFDPAPGPIDTVDDLIAHDSEKVDNILALMGDVKDELDRIADLVSRCVPEFSTYARRGGGSALSRSGGIGIGTFGPSDEIVALTDLLKMLLAELSLEVETGKANFAAAMAALDQQNSDAVASLNAAAREFALSDVGGVDSYDFDQWAQPQSWPDAWSQNFRRRLEEAMNGRAGPTSPVVAAPPESVNTEFQEVVPEFED